MISEQNEWLDNIEGDFRIHKSIFDVMPPGTRVISAESWGNSNWAKTAKITTTLPDGCPKRYFLKLATGKGARALAEGEFHSANTINDRMSGFTPRATGWGEYAQGDDARVYYWYMGDFHDMDFSRAPDPVQFAARIVELHRHGASPNGMFGFHVPTACGVMPRTVTWETSWAQSFAHQLRDVITYDGATNGPWPALAAASAQLLDRVIPRLLGALQADGRQITPTLIHGDLWERNVGTDRNTGNVIAFDPGCTYAHHECEFGTWRGPWATHFRAPVYMQLYQRQIAPSEPVEEWDDRNRLYGIHPLLNASAGHPGSGTRQIAYNDMLYLCQEYAPLETLEKYDSEKDTIVTRNSPSWNLPE